MDFKDCLRQGLIRKNQDSIKRIDKELSISKKFFSSAKKNLDIKEYEMTVIAGYNAIFHCCRALLYKKEYVERNHLCLIFALQHLYKEDEKLLEFLKSINKIRISRHQVQYRGDMANLEEAEYVLDLNKSFLNYVGVKLL